MNIAQCGITISMEERPCEVKLNGGRIEKCLFHGLFTEVTVAPSSPIKRGRDGGAVQGDKVTQYVLAVVESMDGQLCKVTIDRIKFLDGKVERIFKENCYDENTDE